MNTDFADKIRDFTAKRSLYRRDCRVRRELIIEENLRALCVLCDEFLRWIHP